MPRTIRLPRYRDVDRRDVAWWLCIEILGAHRVPSPSAICDYFGMSRAAGYRWHQWAKAKQKQRLAREGRHGHDGR